MRMTYILFSAFRSLEWSEDELVFELKRTCIETGVPGVDEFTAPDPRPRLKVGEDIVVDLREVHGVDCVLEKK